MISDTFNDKKVRFEEISHPNLFLTSPAIETAKVRGPHFVMVASGYKSGAKSKKKQTTVRMLNLLVINGKMLASSDSIV